MTNPERERLANTFPLNTFRGETKRQLVEFILQEIAKAQIEEIEDIDQSRDIEEDPGGIIWCTSCEMVLEDVNHKCGCNNLYDKRRQRIAMLRHQTNKPTSCDCLTCSGYCACGKPGHHDKPSEEIEL